MNLELWNQDEQTALYHVVWQGHIAIVEFLVTNDACLRERSGRTRALTFACSSLM
jgi:hypothetical protein